MTTIPDHTPIVVCPTCARHTAHVMPSEGTYYCLTCGTTHPLARIAKMHLEQEPMWCPSATCRTPGGSLFWPPVNGRRQCRVCGEFVDVKE